MTAVAFVAGFASSVLMDTILLYTDTLNYSGAWVSESQRRNNHDPVGVSSLTPDHYDRALRSLARRDRDLGRILKRFGPPPMWSRRPGFPTLIHIILEQQVSLASARAAFNRLRAAVPRLTPANFARAHAERVAGAGSARVASGRAARVPLLEHRDAVVARRDGGPRS